MSSSSPTVNDLRASFEARSKPTTTITFARPPDIPANKMFPAKLSPIKATIDTVLDTATSAPKGTSTASAPDPTPLATTSLATDPRTSPAAAPATPPPASSPASTASSPAVGSDPATAAAPPAVPIPPPSTPTTNAIPAAADTAPAPPSTLALFKRLTATLRPSWIGPPRPVATTPATMTYPATIKYTSKGLQPPVYIFTSLSDPQWEAVEMDHEILADGENSFSKTFMADEGEYQYKFRLGPGDWWALDDTEPTLDDGAGNKNNVMVVKPVTAAPQASKKEPAKVVDAPAPQQPAASSPPPQAPVSPSQQPPQILANSTPVAAPLLPHEQSHPRENSAVTLSNALPAVASAPIKDAAPLLPHEQTPVSEKAAAIVPNPLPTIASAVTSVVAPLMKHESFFPDVNASSRYNAYDDDDNDDSNLVEEDYDDDDEIFEHQQSPLMRHETLGPDSDEHAHSPLMRHESMTLYDRNDEPDHTYSRSYTAPLSLKTSGSSAADSVCPEADPNDPSLERFPTDHVGIFQHIHRASTQLPADETEAVVNSTSPLLAGREVSNAPSLPSVEEEEEEEEVQDLLREQERLYPHEREAQDEEADPLTGGLPTLMITEPNGPGLADLLTPPMTPQEAEKIIERAFGAAEVEKLDERIAAAEVAAAERDQDQDTGRSRKDMIPEAVQERGFLLGPMGL
ncbi:hypothetical protein LTR91_004660 [Friedmanniomyces endolithicus]|uniref:AMP-activated protein kinase glycogen-binding domain-containing protein n=1 Tax=Friedmanniomyces endolithicus TaxID=329885 RepID=A0AAN6KV42_9PEZI|nr:hypothetical protein LTS02_005229 [Friedmanniomyces endolithicus]KAK0882736.1 hypothetical protein LTR87_003378 [Friedmanniomyces endolithicus]KAK0924632.1 hypothetical protein LTR57_005554 [Friedmanniomyces endolithicus]KAK0977560.1 hypothetical protein LTS01_013025 [Friedmanniomyces endolithicus]KAK1003659.1 hypothetical protein LTR91_004660 [Friedmanniomyces endolithicus]